MGAILTYREQIIAKMTADPNLGGLAAFTRYYFDWMPMKHQWVSHHATQPNVTNVHGIGSGKTEGDAFSELCDAWLKPYFSCLHTSITTPQAEIAFQIISSAIENSKEFQKFVKDIKAKPFPTITLVNGSEIAYRTVGHEAKNIRGESFDRVEFDEGGFEEKEITLKTLRGRLRGRRPDGTPRGFRLGVSTSPTDAEWLIRRFEAGIPGTPNYDPRRFFSQRVPTWENIHLSKEQLAELIADYPEDLARVELEGHFPDYGMGEFSRSIIEQCEDRALNDLMELAMGYGEGGRKSGYEYLVHPRHGCLKWEEPAEENEAYILVGDPGTDSPPRRNAGVVMAFKLGEPMRLVYFHWVNGNGSYMPFIESFRYAVLKYNPVMRGMDTTGAQKAISELAFESHGLVVDPIPFQDKDAMLNSLKFALTQGLMKFPFIQGLHHQLRSYRRKDDKIAQDIVTTLMMAAHMQRLAPHHMGEAVSRRLSRPSSRLRRTSVDSRSVRGMG